MTVYWWALLLFGISDVLLHYSLPFVFIGCLGKIYLHDGCLQGIAGSTIRATRPCALFTFQIFNYLMFLVPCYYHCCMFLPSLFSHSVTIDEISGQKGWKEDRTVLKYRQPKLVSYASKFLYVTIFSFSVFGFYVGTNRKAGGFLEFF